MNQSVPVYVAILDRIENKLSDRLDAHRVKTGKGLPDQEYQRHVGRIAELELMLSEVDGLRKQLQVDEDIDEEPTSERKKKRRS